MSLKKEATQIKAPISRESSVNSDFSNGRRSPDVNDKEARYYDVQKTLMDVEKDHDSLFDSIGQNPPAGTAFPQLKLNVGHSLEDIQEELQYDNLGFDDNELFPKGAQVPLGTMSIANFKNINLEHDDDQKPEQRQGNIPRVTSSSSSVYTIDNNPDNRASVRKRYRKTSTFIITPGDAANPEYELGGNDLKIRVLGDVHTPDLYIELDSLEKNSQFGDFIWVERSRWIVFEEEYEIDSQRFSSPHISPITFQGLIDFRKVIKRGDVVLNSDCKKYTDVLTLFFHSMMNSGHFTNADMIEVSNALISKHFHAGESRTRSNNVPLSIKFNQETKSFETVENFLAPPTGLKRNRTSHDGLSRVTSRSKLEEMLDPGTESLSIQIAALENLQFIHSLFVGLDSPFIAAGVNESNCPIRFIFILFGPKCKEEELMEVGQVCGTLMSNTNFRSLVYSATSKFDIIDATVSFVDQSILFPVQKVITADVLASMLPRMKLYAHIFSGKQDKIALEKFMKEISNKEETIVINTYDHGSPRKISINVRNISTAHLEAMESQQRKPDITNAIDKSPVKQKTKVREFCRQLLPPFYLLFRDIKGMRLRYGSDFRDAFKKENAQTVFLGMIFVYFVVLSPAITFGALYNKTVSPKMSVSMCLLASGAAQLFYMFVCGQPLEVIGITAPLFIIEQVLSLLAVSLAVPLEVFRFWIAIYASCFGIIFMFFNGSIVMKHFRRSVEEIYNCFVGCVYLMSASFTMFKALPYTPANFNTTNSTVIRSQLFQYGQGGVTLFLAFMMVNFCVLLMQIKRGSYLRQQLRNCLGSLNVPLGIIWIIALNNIFFTQYNMPTLNIPPTDKINVSTWINIPSFDAVASASSATHGYCFLISISMFVIFLTEVSTNAINASKVDRRLVKPSLSSINFFCVLVFFPLVSGFLGWPYISGALVRTSAHCLAMSKWSINKPGLPPRIIGTAEQRISGIFAGLLTMLSVFLGSILQYIPMAAMYGMFLYMGVMGIRDLVGFQRLVSLFRRKKHWSKVDYLKDLPTFHIAMLVFFQFFFLAAICVLYTLSQFTPYPWALILFPLSFGAYILLRGYILPEWPRMNTHLSKLDKKHKVILYEGKKPTEQIIVTVGDEEVKMKVISPSVAHIETDETADKETELEKEVF